MRGAADALAAPAVPGPRRRGGRGFTLIEVLLALSMLLVGGVCVMSVFTLAVVHGVERFVESKLDLLRPEARTIAQQGIDGARSASGGVRPPEPVRDRETSQPGFTISVAYEPSPNADPGAYVARAVISYRGKELRQGRLPPMWLYRSTLDPTAR